MATKAADRPSLLAARASFVCEHAGTLYEFREGDLIEADHPIARKYAAQFTEPHVRYPLERKDAPVEQATAAPGEKRGT